MREMGKTPCTNLLHPRYYRRFAGKSAEFPDRYKMSESGVFLRETVLDIPQMEHLFATPRAYNWYMTRKSSEEWEKEQEQDKTASSPINLAAIEKGVQTERTEQMLIYESGKANYRKPTDIDICTEIDRNILPRFGKASVYLLSKQEKQDIARQLYKNYRLNENQIRRCLAM